MVDPVKMSSPRPLARRDTRVAMRRSVVEGSFYAVMFGLAELYFVPDGVRMGATSVQVGLLVGLPLAVGSVGALLGLRLLQWSGRRRPLVVSGVSCQAAVLCLAAFMQWSGQGTLPRLLILVCAYHFFAQLHGASWSSWIGDLVPAPIRGRYFSQRTRTVHLTSFLALLVGGGILQGLERSTHLPSGFGFAVLYTAAGVARVVSAILLASTPEGLPAQQTRAAKLPLRPRWSRHGDRLALVGGLLFFAVYLGSPFFTPYMLEQLDFSYLEYTLASAVVVLCKVVSMPRWGQALDRHGAAAIYRLAILLLAVVPLPWLWVRGAVGVGFAQGLSGFAWAGHEVAFFSLVLETHAPHERARAYTLQSITNGSAQLLGSLMGGLALVWWVDTRWVFAATTVARLMAAIVIAIALREVFARARVGRRALLLRVVGLRPSGGTVHRPILTPDEGDPSTQRESYDPVVPERR